MKFFFALSLALCLILGAWRVQAMTSTNYTIPWDSVNSGGNESGVSTNYRLYDTVGQAAAGASTSTSYALESGYRASSGEFGLSLRVKGSAASPATTYSAFSHVTKTVVLSSSAGYAVGDYIAVAQDVGFGELVAMGRVIQVSGNTLTVDAWSGDQVSMATSPTGGNDLVYLLQEDQIAFGTATVGAEHTSLIGGSVYSSASSGHTVYVQADGNLRTDALDTVDDVSDGTVSADAEEYGAEAIGNNAVSQGVDLPVTTTQRVLMQSAEDAVPYDRFGLLLKLGITSATVAGTYSQTIYFTLTSNF